MTVIRQQDFIDSIAGALRFISYYLTIRLTIFMRWRGRIALSNRLSPRMRWRRFGPIRGCARRDICLFVRIPGLWWHSYGSASVRWDAVLSVVEMVNARGAQGLSGCG
jgi:hypothetical protein